MKLFSFRDKIEGQSLDLAWINICKILSGNITSNTKPIKLGYFIGFFVPFSTKVRVYMDPNTYQDTTGLTRKRVAILIRKPNIQKTLGDKYVISKIIINHPIG